MTNADHGRVSTGNLMSTLYDLWPHRRNCYSQRAVCVKDDSRKRERFSDKALRVMCDKKVMIFLKIRVVS